MCALFVNRVLDIPILSLSGVSVCRSVDSTATQPDSTTQTSLFNSSY